MKPRGPDPVKLVISIFSGEPSLITEAIGRLEEKFGKTDFASELLEFNTTDYYEKEFGGGLKRRLLSFEEFIATERLPEIKLFTNSLENGYSAGGKRRLNIDPGYMALEKFVLASCKGFSHRIYLGNGVYADLTMTYEKGDFRTLPWTYPDYAALRPLLRKIRSLYALKLGKG